MSRKSLKVVAAMMAPMGELSASIYDRQYTDTDPQMLHALWQMETGADPEQSLEEVQGAVVEYDKFRPWVATARR